MGKLREKKWDWPKLGVLPFVLSLLFLGGGILGCIYAAGLDSAGGTAVADYLSDYFALLSAEPLAPTFRSALKERLLIWLCAVLCGLTGLGLVGIPLLCAAQGFLLSYSAACLCRTFGVWGMGAAVVLFGLPAVIWLPTLLLLGCQSMKSAAQMLRRVWGEGTSVPIFSRLYGLNVLVAVAGMALCAAVEHSVVPPLLHALAERFF